MNRISNLNFGVRRNLPKEGHGDIQTTNYGFTLIDSARGHSSFESVRERRIAGAPGIDRQGAALVSQTHRHQLNDAEPLTTTQLRDRGGMRSQNPSERLQIE